MTTREMIPPTKAVPWESWVRWLWRGAVLWQLVVIGNRLEALRRLEIVSPTNLGSLSSMGIGLTAIQSSVDQIEVNTASILDEVETRR
jgi:hypothetical protein